MSLTIDNGTFTVGNSFVTIIEADAYFSARNYTSWTAKSNAEKEAALIKSFDFLMVQAWATGTFTSGIPARIKNAQCIGAYKEMLEDGTLQPDINASIKRERIEGVIETEYFGDANGNPGGATIITAVENMIKPYLKRPGMRMTLSRG